MTIDAQICSRINDIAGLLKIQGDLNRFNGFDVTRAQRFAFGLGRSLSAILDFMLSLALLAAAAGHASESPVISSLDALAAKRDAAALERYVEPAVLRAHPNAFRFLKGGSYAVGKFPWRVYLMREVGGAVDAVFSTPLTVEDMGEQVFRWNGSRITGVVPEDDNLGVKLRRNDFTVHFDTAKKTGIFEDRVQFEKVRPVRSFLIRFSEVYRISKVTDELGRKVPFVQAGGVVSLPAPQAKSFGYEIDYRGVIDLPTYAGAVSQGEIQIGDDYWYPTIARNAAPYTLTAYTPKGWKVIGQGVLESQRAVRGQTESRYRMDVPVCYYSFASAPYNEAEDKIGKWTFRSFSRGMNATDLHVENALEADVIAFYDKVYSPYPFPTWSMVYSKVYGGGALEAYSYATWGDTGSPFEDAHEPSHTWWGGLIPNSYLHSEWNESFADFSEGLFSRERDLGNRDERRLAFIADENTNQAYNAAPVADAPPDLGGPSNALGYSKGAQVMQMLEDELGTETLLKCFHAWLRTHQKGETGEWSGFEAAVNRATGKDYGWFFRQWLDRTGWADFSLENVAWHDGKLAGVVKFNGPAYRLRLEVLLEYGDGKSETKVAEIAGNGPFEIPVSKQPVVASFDPWARLLRTRGDDEQPPSLSRFMSNGVKRYQDPKHADWMDNFEERQSRVEDVPNDLNGVFLVGSPETVPVMKELCRKAGFQLSGHSLTYDGTTIDLEQGGALALVDLPGGGQCAIGLGKTYLTPEIGRARLAVVDQYGRFLRGKTDPKTSGTFTYRL